MKKILFTTLITASFAVTASHASEANSDYSVTSTLPSISTEAMENLRDCLRSDAEIASSKAIRACTKAYHASVPRNDVRSEILTRRGLLQLSAGRFEKASRDFKSAAKMNGQNEFASLGEGFAAVMKQDYAKAESHFNDCSVQGKVGSLAMYGLGITYEMKGDLSEAQSHYQKAVDMRPDWRAPQAELNRIQSPT